MFLTNSKVARPSIATISKVISRLSVNSRSFRWKLVLVTAATRGSEVKGFYPMICNNLGVVLRRGDKKCKESAGFGLARSVLNIS